MVPREKGDPMKTALKVQMGQQLHLTPQLLQSIRLLQLPALELEQTVRTALERNVMLEQDEEAAEDADAGADADAPAVEPPAGPADALDRDWLESAGGVLGKAGPLEDEEGFEARRPAPEPADARLKILAQLRLTLDGRDLRVAEALLDEVDDAGYLARPFTEVHAAVQAAVPGAAAPQVLGVLHHLQRLDPPGYGATDLRDCLLIQLEMLGPLTPGRTLAMRLVADHLEALARPDAAALAAAVGSDAAQVARALRLVRSLAPKPGVAGSDVVAQAVTPDVVVRRAGRGWQVDLANPAAARVRVNGLYEQLLNRCRDDSQARTLRDQLQEARWLVRGLQMRHQTLLRTARVLVERQAAFLERGAEALRPLTLREVADAIGMHESTVSRITTEKYMQTPRGVFELKAFFSNSLREGRDAAGVSGAAVRAMVRRLIEAESPATPLADGVIARLLERSGVRVARRTVSKYREALRIPAARERRAAPPG
jgi:RNA polymerase sigma-54 factor